MRHSSAAKSESIRFLICVNNRLDGTGRREAELAKTAGAQTKDAHGSSDWLTPDEASAARLHEGLLLMGRNENGLLWYNGEGHCLTFAPTGSGKSVSVVVTDPHLSRLGGVR